MATQLEQLPKFDPATSKIGAYLERVDLYFSCNNTASEKVPIFLNVIEGKTYALLRDLVDPVLLSTKSIDKLKEVLKTTLSQN